MSSQNIKEGIEGHGVDWYRDVFDLVFPDLNKKEVSELWKKQLKAPKKGKKEKDDDDDDDSSSDDD